MYFTYTAKYPKLKETVATFQHLLPLKEDLGNCWKDLGIVLKLSPAALRNIDTDYRFSTEKAHVMLGMWMEKEANAATLGCLAAALHKIEKNNIVEKLIGMLMFCFVLIFKVINLRIKTSLAVTLLAPMKFFTVFYWTET